ncbi:MAG: hypothetical protein ACOCXA_02290, partial [Planctomycetota bacterium]
MATLPMHRNLSALYDCLQEYCEALGVASAAATIGVSNDTVRRRLRGEQPWFLEEVFSLAMAEA